MTSMEHMTPAEIKQWLAELISGTRRTRPFDHIINGIVGVGPYIPDRTTKTYFEDMAKSTLCGLNGHTLVEWEEKWILFLGELHGNDSPCPRTVEASNFFQALMHVITEHKNVALVYEGHKHMLALNAAIIKRMIAKGYPFKALNDPDSILRTKDYLSILRTIHVVLQYASKSNARARSLNKRMICFDIREILRMVSAWSESARDPKEAKRSMNALLNFLETLENVDTTAFQSQIESCTAGGACYKDIFIKAPDFYAASVLKSIRQKFVIVYGGRFHTDHIPELLPGCKFLARATCGDPNGSCSRPV